MRPMAKPKKWSHTEGERPNSVTVAERGHGGPVRIQVWDPEGRGGRGSYVRRSLGFRVRDENGELIPEAVAKAKAHALRQAAKLAEGREEIRVGKVTLKRVFSLYLRHRSPEKSPKSRRGDRRNVELFTNLFGAATDPHDIGRAEWERFLRLRRSGAVDARGRRVPEEERRPVGDRALEANGKWLHALFNWAETWKSEGRFLMRHNPIRHLIKHHLPKEKNPQRAAVSQERHEAMLAVAPDVTMEVRWDGGKRETHESWLPELLRIANGTGRRISSIVGLRVEDLHLELRNADHPHGAITWRAENDKEGYAWRDVPIDGETRNALESALAKRRKLGRVGAGPLFPRATDPERPIDTGRALRWFREAEDHEDFRLEPMPRNRTWHGYRAKFARETEHMEDTARAEVGGWKSTETIRRVYDAPNPDAMLRVVTERRTLREASG